MPKITGRIEILANSQPLLNKEGATASGLGLSGVPAIEREAVMGDTGYHGHIEKGIMARCEVTVTDRDDVNLNDLAAINGNGTIIFRSYGGGKVYTMKNATCNCNFSLANSEVSNVVFEGAYWTEGVE